MLVRSMDGDAAHLMGVEKAVLEARLFASKGVVQPGAGLIDASVCTLLKG